MDVRDIERKLDYLEETKQAIKKSIENAGQTSKNIPFRKYNDLIKYYEYPEYLHDFLRFMEDDTNHLYNRRFGAVLYDDGIELQINIPGTTEMVVRTSDMSEVYTNITNTAQKINFSGPIYKKINGLNLRWIIIYMPDNILQNATFNQGTTWNTTMLMVWNNISVVGYATGMRKYYTKFLNGGCSTSHQPYMDNIRAYPEFAIKCDQSYFNVYSNRENTHIKRFYIVGDGELCYSFGRSHNFLNNSLCLEHVYGVINMEKSGDGNYTANGCLNLKSIYIKKIKFSINFSSSIYLQKDCLLYLINNAMDVTETPQRLILGPTNLAKLTNEEKEIATSKGWILQ